MERKRYLISFKMTGYLYLSCLSLGHGRMVLVGVSVEGSVGIVILPPKDTLRNLRPGGLGEEYLALISCLF